MSIALLILSVFSKGETALLLNKPYVFSVPSFDFSGLNTVSFNAMSSEKTLAVDLCSSLQSVVGNKVKIQVSKKEEVDANSLLSKISFFVLSLKIKENIFLVTTQAVVNGTTFNNVSVTVPIYGNTYVIQTEKNAKSEIEDQVKNDLKEFFNLYMQTNSKNSKNITFYCEK